MKKRFLCALLALMLMTAAILPGASANTLGMPDELTEIKAEAFMNDRKLDRVVLPETVTTIGDRAFKDSSATYINLPESITSIGEDAFEGCSDLTATVKENSYAHQYCVDNGVRYDCHMMEITSVSPMGALDGTVRGRLYEQYDPADYRVLVYIQVAGRWYPKTTYDDFYAVIDEDRTFKKMFVTNGNSNDSNANTIAVLLLPTEGFPTSSPSYYDALNMCVDKIIIDHAAYTPHFDTLVFEDDFNGTALNAASWSCETGNGTEGWGNWEAEYYLPENATVSDGTLKLTAKPDKVTKNGHTYDCTSARIRSSLSFKYGRLEVRARCDIGDALWPAIWMLPVSDTYGTWPRSGEIDIYEARGGLPKKWNAALHYPQTNNANSSQNKVKESTYSGDMSDWHVYSVDWADNVIIWQIDGETVQILSDWQTPGAAYPAPFDQKFYVILNLAVGGMFNKELYGNTGVQPGTFAEGERTFEIDYVRIYQ